MRSYFAAVGLALVTLASPMKADSMEAEEILSDEEFLSEEQALPELDATEEERIGNWNQWRCYARSPGFYRPFMGASFYFRPGSGEGQRARRIARLTAIRTCQYYTRQQCYSNVQRDCYVVR
ncbi:hypothetical protein [Oligoflexus tunisiensis]|uniref:hypothetical protein n=1 Tax=Oligoflexus tunisiensis TaxID=708132 RepID=UPI00114CD66C|nr:hypothetical protein [Oligoflexus tunisiensis]